jgi:hypothetical protein
VLYPLSYGGPGTSRLASLGEPLRAITEAARTNGTEALDQNGEGASSIVGGVSGVAFLNSGGTGPGRSMFSPGVLM